MRDLLHFQKNSSAPNPFDSLVLNFYWDSLLHPFIVTLTSFFVNQHPSLLYLNVLIPTPYLPFLFLSSSQLIESSPTVLHLFLYSAQEFFPCLACSIIKGVHNDHFLDWPHYRLITITGNWLIDVFIGLSIRTYSNEPIYPNKFLKMLQNYTQFGREWHPNLFVRLKKIKFQIMSWW